MGGLRLPRGPKSQGKYLVVDGVEYRENDREICLDSLAGRREYAKRLYEMAVRQDFLCAICGRLMDLPTFEHQKGRGMGGPNRDDRIYIEGHWFNAAVHEMCNSGKGSQRYEWWGDKFRPVREEAHDPIDAG